jgi:protein O-mannosyl-transferase
MGKMFWPHDMAVFYPFDKRVIGLWQFAACALLMIVVSVIAIRFRRRHKYLLVGWLWFVAALIPVIGLIQSGGQAMADRYTYVPYIGLFIVIAWGLPDLLSRWKYRGVALGISAVAALMALGICAHGQVSYWKNSLTLFTHAIEVTQGNALAYNNRGFFYGKLGRLQEAVVDLSQAVQIKPDYAEAYSNRGVF